MAAKRYLSLEETAQLLGLRTEDVMRLREKGELRGFADRGTWKFKSDDVEEAKRRRQPDSNPDVPLITDDEESALSFEEDFSSQATMVRGSGSTSDSDVRLILDVNKPSPLAGSSAELPTFTGPGSDSDVRLVGLSKPPSGPKKPESDSDVKLIQPKTSESSLRLSDSDSDVRLAMPSSTASRPDSDSDVRLAMPKGSDSDVKLIDPLRGSAPMAIPGKGSTPDYSDSILLDDDDGISLSPESGIRLGTGGSGIRLGGDSGIGLRAPADSGILLDASAGSSLKLGGSSFTLGGESGLKLAGDSGPKAKAPAKSAPKSAPKGSKAGTDDDLNMTAPMLLAMDDDSSDGSRTDPEVPLLMDDDDLMPKSKKSGSDGRTAFETNVIALDDDDADETVAATGKGKKKRPSDDTDDDGNFDLGDDAGLDDELEVADDVLGEDDELEEMEVFESDDGDFGEDFAEGASAADFPIAGATKVVVPTEVEWSGGTVALVGFSSVALIFGAMVAVDLLRAVWGASAGDDFVRLFAGLF